MSTETGQIISGYETTFITKGEMSATNLKNLKDKIESIVTAHGGEIVTTEDWGKRKLAYPIQKETRGQYTYYAYTGKGDVVAEIERNLRHVEDVIRFLSICVADEFNKEEWQKTCFSPLRQPERPEGYQRMGERDRYDRYDRYDRPERGDRGDRGGRSYDN